MSPATSSFVFISTMDSDPWGGSEELWAQAALNLVADGFPVAASVVEWSPLHPKIELLRKAGVKISSRPQRDSLWQRARRKVAGSDRNTASAAVVNLIKTRPGLVVH